MINSFRKKKFVILVIGIFLAVFLNLFQPEVRNFFYLISEPCQKTFFTIGQNSANFLARIFKSKELEQEHNALRAENQTLKSQVVFLDQVIKENEILRQALELNLQEDFQLSFADICSRDFLDDFILVDKGAADGILEGMTAITVQRLLLGRVEEVYDNFSRVMLITNKKSSFPAKIQENDTQGVIKGMGNLGLFFDLIPHQAQVESGQHIITVGLDEAFPKGIFVGEIESVRESDLSPFQRAIIKPSFDLRNLDAVFIILDTKY